MEIDSKLILCSNQDSLKNSFNGNNKNFINPKHKNFIAKYNPFTLILGSLLYIYQNCISQQLSSDCPYELSCSNFSKVSISQYGWLKGLVLSADRLSRCSHFNLTEIPELRYNKYGKIIDLPLQYRFR